MRAVLNRMVLCCFVVFATSGRRDKRTAMTTGFQSVDARMFPGTGPSVCHRNHMTFADYAYHRWPQEYEGVVGSY